MELTVKDTILYMPDRVRDLDLKYANHTPTKTKEQVRHSDGIRHPVRVTKVSPREMEKLWMT